MHMFSNYMLSYDLSEDCADVPEDGAIVFMYTYASGAIAASWIMQATHQY